MRSTEVIEGTQQSITGDREANLAESFTGNVDWTVKTSVLISKTRKTKIFQRLQSLILLVSVIVFAIISSNLRRDLCALQVQVHRANSNIIILTLKYDRLIRNLNRASFRPPLDKVPEFASTENEILPANPLGLSATEKSSNEIDKTNLTENANVEFDSRTAVRTLSSLETIERGSTDGNAGDKSADPGIGHKIRSIDGIARNHSQDDTVVRIERENAMTYDEQSSNLDERNEFESYEGDDNLYPRGESRMGRSRRDNGRGKKRRKSERRPKRSRRRLGPWVATFVGALPEQIVTNTGYIGPWIKSTRNDTRHNFNKFHLVEDKMSIEVTASGLYMISTQIFYFGENTHYSYWVLLSSEGESSTRKLAKCATVSAVSASEVSCYTSSVLTLQRGDRLRLQQQERNRLINLREGYSYVQLVLLSNNSQKRQP